MHREDVANIRIARIGAFDARRIGDHFFDALGGLFGRGGQLDMIIQTLAHFLFAIDPQYFWIDGILHLRFDQYLCIVTIIE